VKLLSYGHRLGYLQFDAGAMIKVHGDTRWIAERVVWKRLVHLTDQISKGAKPGDIPIQQVTTHRLVINNEIASPVSWCSIIIRMGFDSRSTPKANSLRLTLCGTYQT
jgi:hypothetical protein